MSRRAAFTLIELVVVVTLAALILGVAALQLREPLRKAQLESTLESLEFFDAEVRHHAIRFGRSLHLHADPHAGRLVVENPDAEDKLARLSLLLPKSVTLNQMSLVASGERDAVDRIRVSSRGQSPSYVLALTGAGNERRWLLFSGLTGQPLRIHNAKQVRDIHQMLVERPTE